MLKTIIFDCDGVIADSEPIHFALFRRVLRENLGMDLTESEYKEKYLAMDDRGCFTAAARDRGRELTGRELSEAIAKKTALFKAEAQANLVILPGVVEFIMAASQKYPLAVASGALRDEVMLVLEAAGVRTCFDVIVAAEDVARGKPAPDAYLKALEGLNLVRPGREIGPSECLVIEDSFHGVASAKSAGMKCVAVCTSYPPEALTAADRVVPVLTAFRVSDAASLF